MDRYMMTVLIDKIGVFLFDLMNKGVLECFLIIKHLIYLYYLYFIL